MIEILIVLAAAAAAVYLLRPLVRRRRGRPFLLLVPMLLTVHGPPAAEAAGGDVAIGLLLIAVDVQRDHIRVSEALRLANPRAARVLDLTIMLPPEAVYLTFHRGLRGPVAVPGGFRDRLSLDTGLSEVVYSYALPAGRALALVRTFPLRVERMEIVVRGRGVGLEASRGRAVEALTLGNERLPRWEIRGVGPRQAVTVLLRGLPVSRPWFPLGAAALFAAALASGLSARLRSGGAAGARQVEE